MNNQYLGSCLCEKVTFEVVGSFESFFLCHCKYCQKDTGSAHGANLFSQKAQLKWVRGGDMVRTFNLPSTRHSKSFCKECGSALPGLQMNGQLLVVPAGSLNSPLDIKPNAHIFCSSKAPWDEALEKIATFETLPS
ncbi:GFA family protein [Bdellovibrio sp. SKB1291214]|uniref:GFA family protein n=1 Tax=Bdellovibrio sp. SKB1291214 TaxID=1732569 RepID=UPI000B5182B7|nr:GFA family protein [Bdellovibrio sp. SKB1291214]UYL07928.1 GFA family protein [Bdellovibrio sp. SKB1291214]